MKKITSFCSLAAVALLTIAAGVSSADVASGDSLTISCFPFNTFAFQPRVLFQEVYTAAPFSGIKVIDGICFYADPHSLDGPIDSADSIITYSYTQQSVLGLSSNVANSPSAKTLLGTLHIIGSMPTVVALARNTTTGKPLLSHLVMDNNLTELNVGLKYLSHFLLPPALYSVLSHPSGGIPRRPI